MCNAIIYSLHISMKYSRVVVESENKNVLRKCIDSRISKFNKKKSSVGRYGLNIPPSGIIITTQQDNPTCRTANVQISLEDSPTIDPPKKRNRLFAPIVALSARPLPRSPQEVHNEATLPCTSSFIGRPHLFERKVERKQGINEKEQAIDKRKQSMEIKLIQDDGTSEIRLRKSIEIPAETQSNFNEVILDSSNEFSHMSNNSEISASDEVYVTNIPDPFNPVIVNRRVINLPRSERSIENSFEFLPVITSKVPNEKIIVFSLNKHVLSNQFICKRLIINGLHFNCTTQFYIWKKAKIAENERAALAILHLKDPTLMKEVGRELGEKFDPKGWRRCSWRLMLKANMAKYKQNRALRFELFRTIGATLVEAGESNTWWGVGMRIEDPQLCDPSKWRGANLLGEILMQIRDVLEKNPKYRHEVWNAKKNLFIDRR